MRGKTSIIEKKYGKTIIKLVKQHKNKPGKKKQTALKANEALIREIEALKVAIMKKKYGKIDLKGKKNPADKAGRSG